MSFVQTILLLCCLLLLLRSIPFFFFSLSPVFVHGVLGKDDMVFLRSKIPPPRSGFLTCKCYMYAYDGVLGGGVTVLHACMFMEFTTYLIRGLRDFRYKQNLLVRIMIASS
jgi:hypothetical protein